MGRKKGKAAPRPSEEAAPARREDPPVEEQLRIIRQTLDRIAELKTDYEGVLAGAERLCEAATRLDFSQLAPAAPPRLPRPGEVPALLCGRPEFAPHFDCLAEMEELRERFDEARRDAPAQSALQLHAGEVEGCVAELVAWSEYAIGSVYSFKQKEER